MKTYYKNNLNQAYLVLESEEQGQDDYQLTMLKENQIPGMLHTSIRYVDGMTQYHYDVSGKTSLKARHEKSNLCMEDIRGLAEALVNVVRELQRYMLPASSLLMDPEYIFCEKGNYYFCFYPPDKEELKDKFHKLTEFFVREVDYKDEEGVRLAYVFHKTTMEDNYTIEQILEEFEKETEYTEKRVEGPIVIEEEIDFWEPIRRLLEKRKRTCK